MGFNPNQARAPAGTPEGGQWVGSATGYLEKLSARQPTSMSKGQLSTELKNLSTLSSHVTSHFIESGRGTERPSDTRLKSDPLAQLANKLSDRTHALKAEQERQDHQALMRRYNKTFGRR